MAKPKLLDPFKNFDPDPFWMVGPPEPGEDDYEEEEDEKVTKFTISGGRIRPAIDSDQ